MSHEEARSILGLPSGATPEDINAAHKKLVFKHHPDRNPGMDTTPMMAQINAARDVLRKPEGFSNIDMDDIEHNQQVVQDIEDILGKHQETADSYLQDIKMRREWSDYISNNLSVEELTFAENIAKAPEVEAKRKAYRDKAEKAKARRQEKKEKK